jgi:hypothetical protein
MKAACAFKMLAISPDNEPNKPDTVIPQHKLCGNLNCQTVSLLRSLNIRDKILCSYKTIVKCSCEFSSFYSAIEVVETKFYKPSGSKALITAEPGYNDIGLHDTSSIASHILWYQLVPPL